MKIINDKYIRETYADYDQRVIEFLSRIYTDVIANNEKLSNYFYCMIDLLATQLKLYYMSLDAIDADKKVSSEDSYKRTAKNPAIAVLNHAHQEIIDIMQKLSLSPFEQAKLKRIQNGDEDSSAEQLLNSLVE